MTTGDGQATDLLVRTDRERRGRALALAQLTGLSVLLVLAVAVAVTGLVQHRSIARELRSHASYAALTFADLSYSAIQMRVYDLLLEMDGWIRHAGDSPSLADFDWKLRRAIAGEDRRQIERVFRVDLVTGTVEVAPFGSRADSVPAVGVPADSALASLLRARARELAAWPSAYVLRRGDVGDRTALLGLVVDRPKRNHPRAVYGFVTHVETMGHVILRKVAANAPLLPPSVKTRLPNDRILDIRLLDSAGVERFRSDAKLPPAVRAASPSVRSGHTIQKHPLGLGIVEVTLHPAPGTGLPLRAVVVRNALLQLLLLVMAGGVFAFVLRGVRREQELLAMQSDFVASVSHELRTPLAQIRMYGEMLALDRIRGSDERYAAVDVIVREAKRLGHLVENVLQLTRGRPVASADVPRLWIATVVDDVVDTHAASAAAAGVRVTADVPAGAVVRVDEHALVQMCTNLLDNALKYGASGGTVELRVEVTADRVKLHVDDAGPGIPPAERERVFEAFVRLPRDARPGTTGSGIGLAVVRQLAALYDGTATIAASPAGGTRVTLDFPRASVTQEHVATEHVAAPV
jgi:signal transduction histidine kinase